MVKNVYRLVVKDRLMSEDISEEQARELIENRTKFKLYAAQQHLNNLKMLEQKGSSARFFKERIHWEMEIESFLFHLVGVSDSLLAKANDKLKLKLDVGKVRIENMRPLLNKLNEGDLLSNLSKFDEKPWFSRSRRWRNQVTHITLLSVLFKIDIPENGKPKVFFRDDPKKEMEVIPFLEDALHNVIVLLQEVIRNEPRLV